MVNDVRKIEEFLKVIANASYNGYDTSPDTVYRNLIFLGVDDKRSDLSQMFANWIDRFSNNSNVNVFVSSNWKYFCQFVNRNAGGINNYSAIKLYVALDKDHIYEGVNQIFDYMARENIQHMSKVGKKIRFDDVVIRVGNEKDARKIMDFVNNNQYIREGAINTNPFAVHSELVSVAWDGMLSYNTVVCSWISQYISWEKENNKLGDVCYSRFYAFVQKRSTELFEYGISLEQFAEYLSTNDVITFDDEDTMDVRLLNYYDVTKLMLNAMTPGYKKEDIFNYIKMVSSDVYQDEQLDKIHNLRTNKTLGEGKNNVNEVRYSEKQKAAYILAFKYMCEKYGFNITRNNFYAFVCEGSYDRITSFKGARNLFIENGITKDVASKIQEDLNIQTLTIEKNLEAALSDTCYKYGINQVFCAIHALFKSRRFDNITNRNKYRTLLENSMKNLNTPEDIKICMMEILSMYGYEMNFESIDEICGQYFEHFNANIMYRKR